MATHNFEDFIRTIERLDFREMVEDARAETQTVKLPTRTRPGGVASGGSQSRQYLEDLNGLLIWLQFGRKYPKMDEDSFKKLKPLGERLVRLGQMKEDSLNIFQRTEV